MFKKNHLSIYPSIYEKIKEIKGDEISFTDDAWMQYISHLENKKISDWDRYNKLISFLFNTFIVNLDREISLEHLYNLFNTWPIFNEVIVSNLTKAIAKTSEDLYTKSDFHSIQTRHDGWALVYSGREEDPEALLVFSKKYKEKEWSNAYEKHKIQINLAYRLFEAGRLPEGIKIVKKARKNLRLEFFFSQWKEKTPARIKRLFFKKIHACWSSSYIDYIRYRTNLDMYLYRAGLHKYLKPIYLKNVKGPTSKHNAISRGYTGLTNLASIPNRPQQALRIMELGVDLYRETKEDLIIEEWWSYFVEVLIALKNNYYGTDLQLNIHILTETYFEIYYLKEALKKEKTL